MCVHVCVYMRTRARVCVKVSICYGTRACVTVSICYDACVWICTFLPSFSCDIGVLSYSSVIYRTPFTYLQSNSITHTCMLPTLSPTYQPHLTPPNHRLTYGRFSDTKLLLTRTTNSEQDVRGKILCHEIVLILILPLLQAVVFFLLLAHLSMRKCWEEIF